MIATGRTEEEMARAVAGTREQIAFYGSTPAYRGVLDLHGWAGLGDELNALSRSAREDKWAAMGALIDDDVLHAFAVVAEPAGVAAEIQRRFGGLIDRVSFYAPYETATEAWDLILRPAREQGLRLAARRLRSGGSFRKSQLVILAGVTRSQPCRPSCAQPEAFHRGQEGRRAPGPGRPAARARMPVRWVMNP